MTHENHSWGFRGIIPLTTVSYHAAVTIQLTNIPLTALATVKPFFK